MVLGLLVAAYVRQAESPNTIAYSVTWLTEYIHITVFLLWGMPLHNMLHQQTSDSYSSLL